MEREGGGGREEKEEIEGDERETLEKEGEEKEEVKKEGEEEEGLDTNSFVNSETCHISASSVSPPIPPPTPVPPFILLFT